MHFKVSIKDQISPQLIKLARRLENRRPILEAMGEQLVSLTKRAFDEPAIRPANWAPVKKTGKKNKPLIMYGALFQSIKISALSNNSVTVSTDRPYAAIHQLGGRTRPIPARPFFPFLHGKPTPLGIQKLEAILKEKLASVLR
jgi:phage gpG-like protein